MSAPLSAAILKGVGTTAGGNHFNIELQCSGGLSESGYANIRPLSPEHWPQNSANQGVLLNEKDRKFCC
jgi:hypothetical protein